MQEKSQNKFKRFKIQGTALKPGMSVNGKNYTSHHIEENSGKEVKLFYNDDHISSADNVLGKVNLFEEAGVLKYEGWMMNTDNHTDVVQKTQNGLLDVSISALKNDEEMESINIRNLHLVASPGIQGADVQSIVAESFRFVEVNEKKDASTKVDQTKLIKEASIMEEQKLDTKKILQENEDLRKQMKNIVVESVLDVNPELKKADLLNESIETLTLMKKYEKKLALKESEEAPKEEEKKEEESEEKKEEEEPKAEGEAVAEPAEEKKDDELKESYADVEGNLTLSESAYKSYNESFRKIL